MLPATTERVAVNTADPINQRIRQETEDRLTYYAGHLAEIDSRLLALDREWDIERTLEANAASIAFSGTVLGALVNRTWLVLPVIVTTFLFQHATQGWCPPVPVLRRLGIRTMTEIDEERTALKALRGDFKNLTLTPDSPPRDRARQALAAARS